MIDLPLTSAPRSVTPMPIDFGATLEGPLGGETQRVERLGSRWAVQVDMPPLRHPTAGRIFVSRLIRGISEGVRMPFPLLGFEPGAPGNSMVDGAGQVGRTLAIRGAQPGYIVREGQFLSIVRAGRHHLHMNCAEAIIPASGKVSLSLWPALRVPHLDGDAVHLGKPMIEGLIKADELSWNMALGNFTALSFTLREVA